MVHYPQIGLEPAPIKCSSGRDRLQ